METLNRLHAYIHIAYKRVGSVAVLDGNTGRNMRSRKCGFYSLWPVSGTNLVSLFLGHCAHPGEHWLMDTCFVFYQTTSPISKALHTGSELVTSSPTFIHRVLTSALGNALTNGLHRSFPHCPITCLWPFIIVLLYLEFTHIPFQWFFRRCPSLISLAFHWRKAYFFLEIPLWVWNFVTSASGVTVKLYVLCVFSANLWSL